MNVVVMRLADSRSGLPHWPLKGQQVQLSSAAPGRTVPCRRVPLNAPAVFSVGVYTLLLAGIFGCLQATTARSSGIPLDSGSPTATPAMTPAQSNSPDKDHLNRTQSPSVSAQPLPEVSACYLAKDFVPTGRLLSSAWRQAHLVRVDRQLLDGVVRPEIATTVRVLWSDHYLYLGYTCPFTQLTVFRPPWLDRERAGLWDKDVVEAFIGTDPEHPRRYAEFEVAPTGEKLDLRIDLPQKWLTWNSDFTAAVQVNAKRQIWTAALRIPLAALDASPPRAGTRWRLNLYRHDVAHSAFLAWSPTGESTAHIPARFGILKFGN